MESLNLIDSRLRLFPLRRALIALALFGTSFAYVEASVVVYLRASYEPLHQRLYPERRATDLFPILRPAQLEAAGPEYTERLYTELAREAATLVMLAAVALAIAGNVRQWLAGFLIAFGIWDIFFYVFLRVLTGWPASLMDWDLLFLLPLPWVGPVLAPVIVAVSMIVSGVILLWSESRGRPVQLARSHCAAIFAGGVILVVAFCWDYRRIMAGGYPQSFNWPLFGLGETLGVVAFLHALFAPNRAPTAALTPLLAGVSPARLLR
jgi:hypothetical protein